MKDIVIVGAGGFGREVAWLIEEINKDKKQWNIIGFVDDNVDIQGIEVNGYKVVGNIEWLRKQKLNVVVAMGNPLAKKEVINKLLHGSENVYPVLIHPSVIYSNQVSFGEGAIICAGNLITVNISIGKHVIVNLDCTLGHDSVIEDFSTILPSVNVSGCVTIEECVSVGTGSAIIQGVRIGKSTIIGAGAVVVKDLPEKCTAVGSPARPIKYHD